MGTAEHPAAERMSRADLEREVIALRASRNGGVRARDIERANDKIARLTLIDADRARRMDEMRREHARTLLRMEAAIRETERKLQAETEARIAAETNAGRFHALLLQERVRKVIAK